MRSTIWLLTFVCSSLTLLCLTQAKKFSYKTEDDYRKGLLLQKKVIKIIKDIARREEEDSNVVVAPTPFPYFVRGKRDAPAGGERKKTGRKLVGIPDELRNFVEYEAIHYVDEETINSIDFTNKEAVKELKEFVAEQQKKNARYEFGYVVKVNRAAFVIKYFTNLEPQN